MAVHFISLLGERGGKAFHGEWDECEEWIAQQPNPELYEIDEDIS